MVIITIDTTNDTFVPDPAPELFIILSHLATKLSEHPFLETSFKLPLKDTNGNNVGSFHWRDDK